MNKIPSKDFAAFPGANDADREYNWVNRGMTLRDYFAAGVMSEFAARIGYRLNNRAEEYGLAASEAYRVADEMLKARDA